MIAVSLVILATIGVLIVIYAVAVRPRLVGWGATEDEVRGAYPGVEIIPGARRSSTTMAITIAAPPAAVWPWLKQMGVDRAVWYSWDYWRGRHSANRIHPEWQDVAIGDRMTATPSGNAWWEVAALDPERFLGLRMTVDLRGRRLDPHGQRPPFYSDSLWSFQLKGLPGGRTRLVASGYWDFRPRWLRALVEFFALEPSTWIFQSRQLKGLKRRVEREARRPLPVAA